MNMDSFFRSLRRKLSVDNLFTKGNDEPLNKDEDVRKTLEKTEPHDIIHVDEITEKLKELSEPVKSKIVDESTAGQSGKVAEKSKSSFGVLQKTGEDDENSKRTDNLLRFLD